MIDDPVGHAVRLDAACVVVNLLDVPGQDGLRRDCLEAISHLRAECDRAGMPLMVEPLAFEEGGGGGYESSGDIDRIMRPRPPGGRARRRRHQGRPDRRHLRVPPRRPGRPRAAAAARRRPRHRQGDPRAHPRRARAGRGGHRLRPQRHPAREPGRDDRCADGGRARRRDGRRGARPPARERRPDRHRRRRPDGPRAGGGDRALGGALRPSGHAAARSGVRHEPRGAKLVRARSTACAC